MTFLCEVLSSVNCCTAKSCYRQGVHAPASIRILQDSRRYPRAREKSHTTLSLDAIIHHLSSQQAAPAFYPVPIVAADGPPPSPFSIRAPAQARSSGGWGDGAIGSCLKCTCLVPNHEARGSICCIPCCLYVDILWHVVFIGSFCGVYRWSKRWMPIAA